MSVPGSGPVCPIIGNDSSTASMTAQAECPRVHQSFDPEAKEINPSRIEAGGLVPPIIYLVQDLQQKSAIFVVDN